MAWTGLEDQLTATGAAGLKVDEGTDLARPLMLGDEAMAALKYQDHYEQK